MLYRELNTVGGYLSPAAGGGKITSTQFFLIDKGILQWCAKGIVIFIIIGMGQSFDFGREHCRLTKLHMRS